MNLTIGQGMFGLLVIFEGCFSDGEKVQCFDFLKEIAENKYDMEKIPQDMKEKMRMQMIDAFEWLECFLHPFSPLYHPDNCM